MNCIMNSSRTVEDLSIKVNHDHIIEMIRGRQGIHAPNMNGMTSSLALLGKVNHKLLPDNTRINAVLI